MLQALFKAGILPIPLKHLHTLRINLGSSDSVDGDVYEAIAVLTNGVANVLGLFIDVKPSPKKRCPNLSLSHAHDHLDACT